MSMREIVIGRLAALVEAWGQSSEDPLTRVAEAIDGARSAGVLWQAACAASGEFVSRSTMQRFSSDVTIMGGRSALDRLVAERVLAEESRAERERPPATVEFVEGAHLVDVHDTCRTLKTTGIQRVVREVVRRWQRDHGVRLVAWSKNGSGFRSLSDWETNSVLGLPGPVKGKTATDEPVLIPLSGSLTVAELAAEDWRATRLQGLVAYSGLDVSVIGYDCVPMTASETAADPIAASFPIYLNAIANSSRIAAISSAAATEFGGWRRMLASAGITGPDVKAVELAAEIEPPSRDDLERVRGDLGIRPDVPMVLVVGSHEPRKNHLAVLQAARLLWREGHIFELVFIGGMSWRSERFHEEVLRLQSDGRPLRIVSGADDGYLAAAYALASFSLFPSLHEGFGLPVAESLALGTPVITSEFGSMRELVEHAGGGLLVDPLDDDSLCDAIRSLLTDSALRQRLADEARNRSPRTWDAYAAELYDYFSAARPVVV